jgi:protein-disulfide isomerase/uncharacterized membrane protein
MHSINAPRWVLPLLVLLAFTGAGIGWMLTNVHLGKDPGKLFQTVCGGEGGGCSEVLASEWAVLPGGRPLAALGVVYFGGLGLWYLVVGLANRRGRLWQALPLAAQTAGALASLFFLGVMLTKVHAICWWCALLHLINFVLLFLAWKAWLSSEASQEAAQPTLRLAAAGALLVAALFIVTAQRVALAQTQAKAERAERYAKTLQDDMDLQRYLYLRQPVQPIALRSDDPVRGNPTAPHTVVIFGDFQCPPCRQLAEFSERELLPRFGDQLKIVYRYFPWEPECNPWSDKAYHHQACEAAFAAEAARQLGGNDAFWKMHDVLFAHQSVLAKVSWSDLGRQAGLDGAAVAQRIAAHSSAARIRQDTDAGNSVHLEFTPTVLLDGRVVNDWNRLDLWRALLREPARP